MNQNVFATDVHPAGGAYSSSPDSVAAWMFIVHCLVCSANKAMNNEHPVNGFMQKSDHQPRQIIQPKF